MKIISGNIVVIAALLVLSICLNGENKSTSDSNKRTQQTAALQGSSSEGVYIANYAEVGIQFELSSDGLNWYKYTLQPNFYSTYTFNGEAFGYVRLNTTGQGMVQYKLQNSIKYQISWNEKKQRWDIFLL